MKLQSILLLAAFAGLVAVGSLAADEENVEQKSISPEADVKPAAAGSAALGRLMDFEYFKQKYNKHYANGSELARRAKLFMARAFKVFISSVKYMFKKATKFLKITSRSDWTQRERDVIENDDFLLPPSSAEPAEPKENSDEALVAAVEAEDVERVLAEHPELASIAAELESSHSRNRRSTDQSETRRKLTIDDLYGDNKPSGGHIPEKYTPSVPSNNPDYQQPEVFSEGADDDDDETNQLKPIPEDEAKLIDRAADEGGYLNFLTNSVVGATNIFGLLKGWGDELPDRDEQEEMDKVPEDQMYLDYRDTGCFLQAKSQSSCGSCYAFTAVALMEYHHCRQQGKLVPFSEQYIVDCAEGRMNGLSGCKGGRAETTAYFVQDYGLELSADYPYRAKQLTCPYPKQTRGAFMGHSKLDGLEVVSHDRKRLLKPLKIQRLLEQNGPLLLSILTGDDFSDFGGGVDQLKCDPRKLQGHAMVLIGHGVENGIEYWLIRNSHGVEFGVEGHYKMAKDAPLECVNRVAYIDGVFKQNKLHKGKSFFNELKKKELLAQFSPIASAAQRAYEPSEEPAAPSADDIKAKSLQAIRTKYMS